MTRAGRLERDILHQRGDVTVRAEGNRYTVYVDGLTHATADSSYARTPDGLSIAIARANYIDGKRTAKERKGERS